MDTTTTTTTIGVSTTSAAVPFTLGTIPIKGTKLVTLKTTASSTTSSTAVTAASNVSTFIATVSTTVSMAITLATTVATITTISATTTTTITRSSTYKCSIRPSDINNLGKTINVGFNLVFDSLTISQAMKTSRSDFGLMNNEIVRAIIIESLTIALMISLFINQE
ncbi:hypothetical protein KY290_014532 [Solanum tuberosum]|uniref:Uncharacterized protein n=1 Tax=Solanum tuberosum TaxID=4113 RepID=A0ABQ7VR46_SOLTU|nr:hypothetical protein KY289_014583 [Solanum tuberosum]KAH0770551.1 hypothetical protein KY290_014532 [Solanum tuberosum]